jgi:hypothetical protein
VQGGASESNKSGKAISAHLETELCTLSSSPVLPVEYHSDQQNKKLEQLLSAELPSNFTWFRGKENNRPDNKIHTRGSMLKQENSPAQGQPAAPIRVQEVVAMQLNGHGTPCELCMDLTAVSRNG